MDWDMRFVLGHAQWTWHGRIDMNMQNGDDHGQAACTLLVHAACPRPYCKSSLGMLYIRVHAARPSSCCMSMTMLYVYVQLI